jgi:hypothetical protein
MLQQDLPENTRDCVEVYVWNRRIEEDLDPWP